MTYHVRTKKHSVKSKGVIEKELTKIPDALFDAIREFVGSKYKQQMYSERMKNVHYQIRDSRHESKNWYGKKTRNLFLFYLYQDFPVRTKQRTVSMALLHVHVRESLFLDEDIFKMMRVLYKFSNRYDYVFFENAMMAYDHAIRITDEYNPFIFALPEFWWRRVSLV